MVNADGLIKAAGLFFVLIVIASVYRRRDEIRYRVSRFVAGVLIYLLTGYIAAQQGLKAPQAVGLAVLVTLAASAVFPKRKRSRYVRAAERRKVIAQHELSGKKFRKGKDELDHEIPVSRGGSSTADNLRVVSRKENRRKGAKSPWWDVFGR